MYYQTHPDSPSNRSLQTYKKYSETTEIRTARTQPPTPAPAPKQMEPVPVAAVGSDGGNGGRVFASPLVRRIARQENVDLKQLEGSGWKGRITKKDIEDFIGKGGAPAAAPTQAPAPVPTQRPAATPASERPPVRR